MPVPTLEQLDEALDKDPGNPAILHERGLWLLNVGRLNEALVCLDLAIILDPTSVHTYVSRSACYINMNRCEDGIEDCTKAISLDPNCCDAYLNRGAAWITIKKPEPAVADLEKALTLRHDVRGLVNLCAAHHLQGKHKEALDGYRKALEMDPNLHVARSSLIACLDFIHDEGFEIFQHERRLYYEQHGSKVHPLDHLQDNDPDRPLTIGYVGADFRYHSAAFCFKPLIERRDRENFKVNIYSGVTAPDAMTQWFRQVADLWRDTMGMPDAALAQRIRNDRVDILVDLSGHSVGNKLMAFAHKPAPIQITAWGHGGGTGLKQVDYQFTDPIWIPTEVRHLFAEKCWDLPCFITFEPPSFSPPVKPLPMLENRYITFGCMNRYQKVTPQVEALWAQVLNAVPDSRMIFKDQSFENESNRQAVRDSFEANGIDSNRLEFRGGSSHYEHLNAYGDCDVLLDSFPMGGGITTWEALYMGVPTITKLGSTQASRIAGAIEASVGIGSFVVYNDEQYIDLARLRSTDYVYMGRLRKGLRGMVTESDAGNPDKYTKAVETAYRSMWREWCQK